MQHVTAKLGRISLLLALFAGLLCAAPLALSPAHAAATTQCSDGIDNDGDNAIDGADAGCGSGTDDDETDSPYAGIVEVTKEITHVVALPVVTIQGTVSDKGVVDVKLFQIRALRGSNIKITCSGAHCPFKTLHRTMITSTLRLNKLETPLKPAMTLKLRIRRRDELGKYMKYVVRKGGAPTRTDKCIDQDTGLVRGCFKG